jgi:hypothetical protein
MASDSLATTSALPTATTSISVSPIATSASATLEKIHIKFFFQKRLKIILLKSFFYSKFSTEIILTSMPLKLNIY